MKQRPFENTFLPGFRPSPLALLLAGCVLVAAGCAKPSEESAGAEATAEADTAATDTTELAKIFYGPDPVENGRLSYETYCASCHGIGGKGNGPVAEVLTAPPADLTHIASRRGGTYPTEEIFTFIDGREAVRAHGTREMPVWGNIWIEKDGVPVSQAEVDRRINELVEYLRTIQEGGAAEDTSAT
jgi:mono/diheme cytochrome c family protein